MLGFVEPFGRDGHLGLFVALEASQLVTDRVEPCFHGTESWFLLARKMGAIELGRTATLHQRCFGRRYAAMGAMLSSEKVVTEAEVCIETMITKLVAGQQGAKRYSIKKLLSHFSLALK